MKKNNYFWWNSTYLWRDITSKKEKIIKPENFVRKSDMLHGNKIGNLTGIYDAKKIGKIYQKSWSWGLLNMDSDSI